MVILFPGFYYYGDAMKETPWVEDLEDWNIVVGRFFVFRRESNPFDIPSSALFFAQNTDGTQRRSTIYCVPSFVFTPSIKTSHLR